jgi:hypothetical protein
LIVVKRRKQVKNKILLTTISAQNERDADRESHGNQHRAFIDIIVIRNDRTQPPSPRHILRATEPEIGFRHVHSFVMTSYRPYIERTGQVRPAT